MRLRRLRDNDVLEGDTSLVRGGELDPDILRADAQRYHDVYAGDVMEPEIDLIADLNAEDDEGLGWSTLSDARDRTQVRPGVMLVAGNRLAKAVVRVVAVDDDGQVHFMVMPGALEKNRHLIGRRALA